MKFLVVEDDFIARRLLKEILCSYGECDVAVDGEEAIHAFKLAWQEEKPYDLICMDIMMPKIDGQEAIKQIRELENGLDIGINQEVKIIMVTALGDSKNVVRAFFEGGATAYMVKPINKQKVIDELRNFKLIN